MKAKKLLSAAITAAMCLNLFVGTGFAADDADSNSDVNQISGGGGNVSESSDGGGNTTEPSDGGGNAAEPSNSGGNVLESPDEGENVPESSDDGVTMLSDDLPKAKDAWTICVYLCGSDLESGGSAASGDLLEMLESVQTETKDQAFPEDVNLLVMTGGAEAWDPEGLATGIADEHGLGYREPSAERVELFKITSESGMERLNDDLDNWIEEDGHWSLTNNMANPDTAKIFGSFAIDQYPAEHMMYVFWDHGGAFIAGCELDRINDDAMLSSADVNDIIEVLAEKRGEKLDLVGFDACLMSGMEMAQVLSDSADYMLASEEVEPGPGWDYHWLYNIFRDPANGETALDIGREIIDLYPDGFAEHDAEHDETCDNTETIWNHAGETTLALTDLGKIGGLIDAFDEMAAAMGAFADNEALSDHFADLGFAISQSAGSAYQENLLDVYDYAQNVVKLYTDGNSSLYGHQNAGGHTECAALYEAAQEVSGYFDFGGAPAEGVLLSGTGNNPIVYRGRGKQAARGGLSVFGPVLSSKQVDSHSEVILKLYEKLDLLDDYSKFIETLNSKKQEIGNFTGSMNVTSTVNENNELVSTLSVKPRNTGVSVVEVNAQIAYTDLSTGNSYWLGEMPVDTSNRKDMVFTYAFDGKWQTLDDKFCTMNIQSSDNGPMFTIPAYVKDGSRKVPVMVITQAVEVDVESGVISALTLGYMEIPEKAGEAEVTNRITMMGTEAGQKSELTFSPVLVSDGSRMDDPAGWTEVDTEVTVDADKAFIFPIEVKELASGLNNLYEARFALTDIMGKTHISSPEPFFMIDNINDFSAVPIRPQVYEAGKPATPPVRLFFGDTELVQGEHFLVKYTGNDGIPTPGNPVTATVTITDIEDPTSERELKFLICTEEDYESTYMNWIAGILESAGHVPGDEVSASGLLMDMINPLDEYIVHAVLAEELQLQYELCTAAERSFFTQDRLEAMQQHYSGATRGKNLTSNGVTLVGALKLMDAYGYLSLIEQPESGLTVTLGQPSAAQLAEWNVDGQYFTDALADARSQNDRVTTAQTYNPVFQVKVPVNDLAWEIVVENLSEGENIENLDDAELTKRYEEAQAQIREIFGDVEYVERPLRQTGESEDLRLVLKIAVPSGYYENTASLYRIDGIGYKKLGEEDGLHFVTENGVSYAVFETRALHEGCWYVMMAAPVRNRPSRPSGSGSSVSSGTVSKPNTSDKDDTKDDAEEESKPGTALNTPDASGTQSTFIDVPAGEWYSNAVSFVQQRGLMSGSNGRFSPNENLSRGMLSQILFQIEGRPAGSPTANFSDVANSDWFADAVAWAAAKNIVSGYGNGLFGPNDSVTREQLAVMLWRYAGSPAPTNQTLSFPDADAAGEYARTALCWAVEKGIMNGIGGRLDANGTATRAQVAQMLKSFIENQT